LNASEPSLTVALATYNGRALLEIALASLATQSFRDFRTIVVDDGSTDGTAAWLAEQWPDVQLIAHPTNRGVTATLNTGLRASRSPFVCLLNNDVELDRDCLGELMRALREHPDAGSATPKLLAFYDREILDGAGDTFHWGGTGWRRGHGERDIGQYDRPQPIFAACAGVAIYTRTALDTVGLLDEDFFAFYEDVDWSFRAQLAGFACRYVPTAVAYHIGSATLGKGETDFTRYHTWRNGIWVVMKDYPLPVLLWQLPRLVLHQVDNFVVAVRERKLALLWRVWRDAVRALPKVLLKRAAVQRTRRVSLKQLAASVREAR
jgi:GT2 family glycosyltransferase